MQQDETFRLLCDEAWTGAHSFALYRQPGEQRYTFVTAASDPQRLTALSDVGRQSGVVVAPWQAGAASPLLLIPADSVVQGDVPALSGDMPEAPVIDASIGRADYEWGFRRCMDRLSLGVGGLTKVVYARQMAYAYAARRLTMADLFLRACHLSPYSYVTLWHTPRTGFWLIATPEVLVSALGDGRMQTMALAGTMPWTGTLPPLDAWSAKNRHEQQVVAAYIAARLDSMAADVQASPCGSRRAGNVVHLCTTFTFRPAGGRTLGDIVAALHPTPAVCGEPLKAAKATLRYAERQPRLYYAGFSGPVGIGGTTTLYVSLRCAHLMPPRAVIYAGGGLLPDSRLDDEWEETQLKMQHILRCLA